MTYEELEPMPEDAADKAEREWRERTMNEMAKATGMSVQRLEEYVEAHKRLDAMTSVYSMDLTGGIDRSPLSYWKNK